MSEASGRKAQDSAELSYGETLGTSPEAIEARQKAGAAMYMGVGAAATAGLMGIGISQLGDGRRKSPAKRRKDNKKRREQRRARRSARGGGGGGLYVTPDAAKRRDVTKRFRNI